MDFKITSQYKPTGDQPQAIRQLTEGIQQGEPAQVLLGVTGSGKTFTVANVIANVAFRRPYYGYGKRPGRNSRLRCKFWYKYYYPS